MPRRTKEELAAARQAARDEVERFLTMRDVEWEWPFEKRPIRLDELGGYSPLSCSNANRDFKKEMDDYYTLAKEKLNHMRECKDLKELSKTIKAIQDAEPEIFHNCIYMHNKIAKLLDMLDEYKKIKELEENVELEGKMILEYACYWLELEGGKRVGPFCRACYEDDDELALLKNDFGFWKCMSCGGTFDIDKQLKD